MCEFVSWKLYNGKLYFLTDEVIGPRLDEFKSYNAKWKEDIVGHGAIERFFNLPERCGQNAECTDFSSPSRFPPEIVSALKNGEMTFAAFFPEGLLLAPLYADYKAKWALLDADYKAKWVPLYADYKAKLAPLDADYEAKLAPLDADYEAKRSALYSVCWRLFTNTANRSEAWRD